MYPITQTVADLFAASERQVMDINLIGVNETLHLTEANIIQGGFILNRYSTSGSTIEIGSAVAAEVQITLDNSDGSFNAVTFAGGRMFIRVGVKDWSNEQADPQYIPLGFFTIDDAPRKLKTINFTALDDMVLFDKAVDMSLLSLPMTVADLVSRICDICNVTLDTNVSALTNGTYQVTEIANNPATYRQILMWCAELTGTCAMIDWKSRLIMKWYDGDSGVVLNTSNRFSSDIAENLIEITGINVSDGEISVLAGSDDYALNIEGNGLIASADMESIAQSLYSLLGGFSYLPYTATVLPMPYLYPLDRVWVTASNFSARTVITEMTFKLNGNTELGAVGETEVQKGYAALNPMTGRESAIINHLLGEQNADMNDRVQSVLAFNELISNALGLYVTPVEQPDGSTIYYLHNQPDLANSSVIFTMTANGIAWTNTGWNDGNPVWSSGVTEAGDALFRFISAQGIEVSAIGEDYSIEITPRAFRIYYRNMLVTNIEADEMTIPKAVFTSFAECGRVRLVPYGTTGTNLVFVD
jgi:hypothetical protein